MCTLLCSDACLRCAWLLPLTRRILQKCLHRRRKSEMHTETALLLLLLLGINVKDKQQLIYQSYSLPHMYWSWTWNVRNALASNRRQFASWRHHHNLCSDWWWWFHCIHYVNTSIHHHTHTHTSGIFHLKTDKIALNNL